MKEGTRAALRLVSVVALAGAALLAAAIVGLPICPTKLLFGVPCPGCGLTRAMIAIAKGDFAAMARHHPLAPLVLGFLLYALATAAWDRASPREPARAPGTRAWAALVLVLVGVWVVRLSGGLGGPSDPIDPAHGLLTAPLLAR
ncbi:MAG: DUF2752 domain-containing protein [Polyangiales bacterium]